MKRKYQSMTTRPMTDREKIAYTNTRTCLNMDSRHGLYWSIVMAKELQIVLDYVKEVENG